MLFLGKEKNMMDTTFIHGIIPPVITPIDQEERIDEAKLREQLEYIIQGGCAGVLLFGSNGEFYVIEDDEMERGLKIAVDQAAGRIPVFFGIGAISTRKCIRLAKMAFANGAKAVSVLQPMYIKPDERELYLHYKTIADAVAPEPMLIYNNPGRAGYGLSADLVVRLNDDCENIVGIKDTSGDMTLVEEIVRRTRHTGFRLLGGKDTLLFPTLVCGGYGGVCTMANVYPELVNSIYNKFVAGDIEGSREAQYVMNPIRLSMDKSTFPVAAKAMCKAIGRDMGVPYLPTLEPSEKGMDAILNALKEAGPQK